MKATPQQLERALELATVKNKLSVALHYLEGQGVLCFGIEKVSCADRRISYVNFGETYEMTVCKEGGEFFLASWGGWYEETENKHCEESGEVSCGYCGEFTPCAEEWSETTCEHCGRNVANGQLPSMVLQF